MQPSLLDRAIGYVSPGLALKRQRARVAGAMLARHYEAAAAGRRTQGWRRSSGDANAAMWANLAKLREHARDLVRNNPHAPNALDTIADHVVGWGITAKPKPADNRAKEAWEAWASTPACDADGRHDFYGLQKLVMRTVVEAGECLVRRRTRFPDDTTLDGKPLPLPIQLQVLEPDYIDTSRTGLKLKNGGRIIHGVEFDALGRRVAYWLFPEHPGADMFGGAPDSRRIPAEGVLHVFRHLRPGQVRGASWLAPVILKMKEFDEYDDAQLMKQKIAACLAVITSDVTGNGPLLGAADSEDPSIDSLDPGMILNVAPGRTVDVVQPPSVREFADFASITLRAIAAGLGVTYEDLTGDYCIAPETRVLRADLRWVRADELAEGDELVAFDEERPKGKGQRRKWRKASVVRAGRKDLPRVRVITDKATVLVSSEHSFLCVGRTEMGLGQKGYGHIWVRADQLKPGDKIAFLAQPWGEGTTHAHGYLKGISDGEGHVNKAQARIGISQKAGPVLDEIGETLRGLGFSPRIHGKPNARSGVYSWDIFGTAECLRFLGEVRPTRLLEKAAHIYEGIAMSGGYKKRGEQSHAIVVSAEDVFTGPVVTLSTTTQTVITEGLCSHNTNLPFSAARMSRLRHWARVDDWRWQTLIPQFCAPAWGWAMQAAAIMRKVEGAPTPVWTAPPPPMLDPTAEGTAYKGLVRIGALSWPEMVRERGYDPEDVLEEIAEWNAKLDDAGVVLDSDPRKLSAQGQEQPSETKPEEPEQPAMPKKPMPEAEMDE